MPTDQGLWFDDGEGVPPVEQTGESSQCKPNSVGGTAWLDLSLDKKAELFPQKKIFGRNGNPASETHPYKGQCIRENAEDGPSTVPKRLHHSILLSH